MPITVLKQIESLWAGTADNMQIRVTAHVNSCAGAEILAMCMEKLYLESIDLNRNYVADVGAISLGLAMQRHGKCHAVHLQFNGVRDSGAMALAVALKLVPSLFLVDLRGNSFPFMRKKIGAIVNSCSKKVQFLH